MIESFLWTEETKWSNSVHFIPASVRRILLWQTNRTTKRNITTHFFTSSCTGRAALSLAERLHTAPTVPVPFSQVSESLSWGQVPTLVKLCLNAIRAWITQYAEAFSAARLGLINEVDPRQMVGGRTNASQQSDDAVIHRRRLELWVAHHLSGIRWPDILGQQLIQSLVDEKCFTARTAVLLRKYVPKWIENWICFIEII